MRVLRIIIGVLALLGVAIALAPEPPAKAIPGMQVTILRGKPDQHPLAQVFVDLNSNRGSSGFWRRVSQ